MPGAPLGRAEVDAYAELGVDRLVPMFLAGSAADVRRSLDKLASIVT